MKRKTIIDLRASVTIIVFVLFAGYSEAQTKTYNKFGFTFDYPADMTILVEKGAPSSGEEASEEAGVLRIGRPEVFFDILLGKPGVFLEVFWIPAEAADNSYVQKVFGEYLGERKKVAEGFKDAVDKHSIRTRNGEKMRFAEYAYARSFYLGDIVKSRQNGHEVLRVRFCTRGEEGHLLNVSGAWFCDRSKRIFIITSSARWEDVRFSMTFEIGEEPKKEPEWPDLETDPSYEVYEKVIDSFHCHSLTPPTEDRFNFQELKAKADTFFKNREVNTTVTMREEDGLANLYFDIKLDNIKDSETFNIVSILIILFVGESTMDIPWEQERTVIICGDEVIYWIHTTDCVAAHKASEEGNLEEMRKILNSKLHFWK